VWKELEYVFVELFENVMCIFSFFIFLFYILLLLLYVL